MSDRKFATDMGSWKRLGRRWIAILSAMLCGNFCLIVLAVAGFGGSTPNSGEGKCVEAVGELCEDAVVISEAAMPEPALSEEKPVEVAEITATAVPTPATAESEKTESLAKTEPQSKQASEQEQQAATEAANGVQEEGGPL